MQCELEDILRQAGMLMLRFSNPNVHVKSGHANFVTEADVAVQAFLKEALLKRWPGAQFLAEEDDVHHLSDSLTFVIDPIDGTTNYMRHRRLSAISIGAVEHGKAVFGAIYDPYHNEIYHSVRGKGAFCNDAPLHVSSVPFEDALIALGTSPYDTSLSPLTATCLSQALRQCGDVRRTGSAAIDLCDVAAGRCEGAFEWSLQPWDYCAGSLLVEEAGGKTGGILGCETSFSAGMPFMSGTALCFDKLRALLQQCHSKWKSTDN